MIQEEWMTRACPICGDTKTQNKSDVKSNLPAEDLSFRQVRDYFVGLRSDQVFFTYKRCKSCELLYCPIYFSQSQLDILYCEMPDNLMGEDKATASRTQLGYAKWLEASQKRFDAYMEIGPDIGLVAQHVINRVRPSKVLFVEPNLLSYPQLEMVARDVPQRVLVRNLSDLHASQIDLVYGIHVYDHLLEPLKDLRTIRAMSNFSANFALVVHNEKSILRKILGAKWPPFCLQHPQLFNPETLGSLLSAAGWRVNSVSRTINWWHLNNILATGLKVLGLNTGVSNLFPRLELPLRLGNILVLAEAAVDK